MGDMKRSAFITSDNLPDLAKAFSSAAQSAGLNDRENDLKVSIIGEPGVGKSYIATKLAEGLLGAHMLTHQQSVPRDNMHDLILWSVHSNKDMEVIQYDEASLRFVDDDYHNFVMQQRKNHPIPERIFPGMTFIEHPDQKTEDDSDIVVRIRFSEMQQQELSRIRAEMEGGAIDIAAKKQELADIAAQGCVLEIETQGFRVDETPLIKFFDFEDDDGGADHERHYAYNSGDDFDDEDFEDHRPQAQ